MGQPSLIGGPRVVSYPDPTVRNDDHRLQYDITCNVQRVWDVSVVLSAESKFGKREFNRGSFVDGHWVFGGMERTTGECFLVEVEHRDAATLLPIIQQFVRPGSIHRENFRRPNLGK